MVRVTKHVEGRYEAQDVEFRQGLQVLLACWGKQEKGVWDASHRLRLWPPHGSR